MVAYKRQWITLIEMQRLSMRCRILIFALLCCSYSVRLVCAQNNTSREVFLQQSNTLAQELGETYGMGLNCNEKLSDVSPAATADLLAGYLSNSELKKAMQHYSSSMQAVAGRPCDLDEMKSSLVEIQRHLAQYVETAKPFVRSSSSTTGPP